jgi:hypothetical protein
LDHDCGPENATEFIGTAKQKYLIYFIAVYFGGCDLIDIT